MQVHLVNQTVALGFSMVVVLLCLVENLHVGYNLLLMNQVFAEMLVFTLFFVFALAAVVVIAEMDF